MTDLIGKEVFIMDSTFRRGIVTNFPIEGSCYAEYVDNMGEKRFAFILPNSCDKYYAVREAEANVSYWRCIRDRLNEEIDMEEGQ